MSSANDGEVGERLLPALVDRWAETDPQKPFCSLPSGPKPIDGLHPVTFADVAGAADCMSWWIETTIGYGTGETLAYMGTNDIRYLLLLLACCKTGYRVR